MSTCAAAGGDGDGDGGGDGDGDDRRTRVQLLATRDHLQHASWGCLHTRPSVIVDIANGGLASDVPTY